MTTKPTKTANKKGTIHTGVLAGANVGKAAPKAAQPLVKHLRRDVVKCSACGQDHARMLFILRSHSARKDYPYAGTCPLTGKQVLKVND